MKKIMFVVISVLCCAVTAKAQSGTNSPYSGYGLGKSGDVSTGISRGMNGVGIAFRESNHVNYLNPASYSGIDSLTFIFDIGMSLQNTNFKEGSRSKNAKNADFEYAIASFRAMRHLGISFGFMPYSNVGYSYSSSSSKPIAGYVTFPELTESTTTSTSYSGSGGLHQIFLGAGWQPYKDLSIGVNINYLYGTIDNSSSFTYSDSYAKSLTTAYTTSVNSIKLDFGVDYSLKLSEKRTVTVGVTYTPGHRLGADSECRRISNNPQTSVKDTVLAVATNALAIPTQIALGVSYKYANRWLLGLDYSFQNWSSINSVDYIDKKDGGTIAHTDSYSNRHKINVGGQYCENELSRSFFNRLRYRFGVGYSTSYLKINGKDGPDELSVSAGVGIPIINSWNNRSILNLGVSWLHSSAKNMITENTLMLNVGLTFNERWFSKWKFE